MRLKILDIMGVPNNTVMTGWRVGVYQKSYIETESVRNELTHEIPQLRV